MIETNRDRRHFYTRINLLLDVIATSVIYYISVAVWLGIIKQDSENIATQPLLGILFICIKFVCLTLMGLYDSHGHRRLRRQFLIVFRSLLLETAVTSTILVLYHLGLYSRGVLLSYLLASSAAICVIHFLLLRFAMRFFPRHAQVKHVLIVGTGRLAREFQQNLLSQHREAYDEPIELTGFVGRNTDCTPYIGQAKDLDHILDTMQIDEVVAALDVEEAAEMANVIRACEHTGTKVSIIPYYNDLMPSNPAIEAVGTSKLINLRSNPLDDPAKAAIKRGFDLVVSLLLILLLSPLLLFLAIGTKLSSPGPVLFRQERVGKYKKPFTMYKFRSMRVNDREKTAWSTKADPRKTKFGSVIRKFSLDELPQLFNVVKGDMSLIGPRPEIPFFVDQFKDSVPLYMVKHQVRPGMTGWAQVNGYRGDTSIVKRIEHDIWYIENWTMRLDLKILFMTAMGGFMNNEKTGQPPTSTQ